MGLTPPMRARGALGLTRRSSTSSTTTASKAPTSGAMQQGSIRRNATRAAASVDTGREISRDVKVLPATLTSLHACGSVCYMIVLWGTDVTKNALGISPVTSFSGVQKTAEVLFPSLQKQPGLLLDECCCAIRVSADVFCATLDCSPEPNKTSILSSKAT